jgi:hypothetical protein
MHARARHDAQVPVLRSAVGVVALLVSCAACADDPAGTQLDESDCALGTLESDAPGAVAIRVTGAGPCSAIAGVLEIDNRSGGDCGSDINAFVEPGSHRLSVTGGQYGGEGGSWEPLPADIAAVSGVMTYREGVSTWPLELPPLQPGEYTIRVQGVACDDLLPLVEAAFVVERA